MHNIEPTPEVNPASHTVETAEVPPVDSGNTPALAEVVQPPAAAPAEEDLASALQASTTDLETFSVDAPHPRSAAAEAARAAQAAGDAKAAAMKEKPAAGPKKEHQFAITTDGRNGLEEVDVTSRGTTELTNGPADNPNVEMERDYNVTPPKPWVVQPGMDLPIHTHFLVLSEQSKEADQRIRSMITPTLLDSRAGMLWDGANMVGSSLAAQYGMVQAPAQDREGSKFKQFLEHEGARSAFFTPALGEAAAGNDPVQARIRVRSLMKNGAGMISVPLWHSGFWLMLYAPSESAMYELNRRFNDEKVSLGRMTQGLIFSNEQVYMNSWLTEFCMDHVYDASVKFADVEELRKHISVLDLPILFAGLARLIWPKGYNYLRSIVTKQGIEQSQMVEGVLDIAKLMWVDNTYFTPWQKNHMATRTRAAYDQSELARYQKEFRLSSGRTIELDKGIEVVLSVPNSEDSIKDGDRWVNGLVQMVDETFTTTRPTTEQRNRIISSHAGIQEMMRYASWVKEVILEGKSNTNREVVEEILSTLSGEADYREKFDEAIRSYIADTTAALIGIPEYSGIESGPSRFPRIIPLDVVTVFFTLLVQKTAK